jgi:hypothetical protein
MPAMDQVAKWLTLPPYPHPHADAGRHDGAGVGGGIAAVVTPLAAVAEPLDASVAAWLLGACGGNVDLQAAA